jgi:hypothetical protein
MSAAWPAIAALVLVAAHGAPPREGNFIGEAWNGTVTLGGTCTDGTKVPELSNPQTITFKSRGGNRLEYTNITGCHFEFALAGTTARLSNPPVTCSATDEEGASGTLTYTGIVATTTDGHNLTMTTTAFVKAGPKTCNITGSGSFKR